VYVQFLLAAMLLMGKGGLFKLYIHYSVDTVNNKITGERLRTKILQTISDMKVYIA